MAEDVNKADEQRRRREKARSLSSPSVTTPQPLEAGDNSNYNFFLGNLTAKLNRSEETRPIEPPMTVVRDRTTPSWEGR